MLAGSTVASQANLFLEIDLNSFNVEASGSLVLFDATTSNGSQNSLNLPGADGVWGLMFGVASTPLSPLPDSNEPIQLFLGDGINWSILDVSEGDAVIASSQLSDVAFQSGSQSGILQLSTFPGVQLGPEVDAGDILTISGSASIVDFLNVRTARFRLEPGELRAGTFTSQYNGQTLTLNVVPEPSTYAAIFGVAALGLALVRWRLRRTA